MTETAPPTRLWGGRFSDRPAELMQAINVSIGFDRRLAEQDLAGSRAHAAMLRKAAVAVETDSHFFALGTPESAVVSRPGSR